MESLCLCFNGADTVCESKDMFLRALKRAPFVSAISVFSFRDLAGSSNESDVTRYWL